MLAVISDLHLQHTADDVVRYRGADGRMVECGVRRNVSAGALRRWCAMIHEAVVRQHVQQVEIVLAGDVFELHRTPLWFYANPQQVRPATDPGPDVHGNPMRDLLHRILDAVAADNRAFLRALQRFVRDGSYVLRGGVQRLPDGVRVDVHYLPGNHDRLANAWPSLRSRIRRLLAMPPSEAPFPHELRRPNGRNESGYGVLVRHGQEFDCWNFAGDVLGSADGHYGQDVYLRPSIGDQMTVDIATRMGVAFRACYAVELRQVGPVGDRYRRLYQALLDFDDVRPAHALFDYLAQQRTKLGGDPLQLLRPVVRDVYATACRDPFVVAEAERLGIAPWFTDPIATMILTGIAHLPSRWAVALPFTWPFRAAEAQRKPADLAQREPGLQDGSIDVYVAGHTHFPDQVPIRGRRRRAVDPFFLDSGTWRASILYGAGERFGRIQGHTAIFCYAAAEHRRDGSEGRRFETWTAHFAAGRHGPYAEPRGELRPATHRLRFVRLVVEDAPPVAPAGTAPGGPQVGGTVALRFGVDARVRHWHAETLRAGDVVPLDAVAPVLLHPDLDGELWFCGLRMHTGLFEPDDPLPWALQLLPRAPGLTPPPAAVSPQRSHVVPRPAFVAGPGELVVHDGSGWRIRLGYAIEPLAAPAVVHTERHTARAEPVR